MRAVGQHDDARWVPGGDRRHRAGARLDKVDGDGGDELGAQAIRGVALGVGLTAVIQSALGGIGLVIAGVPFAGVMTALLFMLCITQIGMLVLLLPAVVWVYWTGHLVGARSC